MLGQRRLAIVVSTAFTKCIVNSSFRVRGRNCSIDVSWERRNFRVVCSHLNKGSDARLCEGLGRPEHACWSRMRMSIFCVDAQTGLCTGVPGSASSNIGRHCHNCYTSRRRKQRLLECFIMDHLLTATNTLSSDDDRNTNIYTCNYHGCHEPQQIDCIFSFVQSLSSRVFDSSATASDHWGLTATIRERYGKTLGKRHVRNPIGWECNDHIAFNNIVRTQLNGCCCFLVRSCGSVIIVPLRCSSSQMARPGTSREDKSVLDGDSLP